MIELTALVLTYNERENIERTLSALTWVTRIVVLDSFSTDSTCELAATFANVCVIQRVFDNHTDQWNYGLDQIESPWVLTLDADYEITHELAREIQGLFPAPEAGAFSTGFEFRIHGHRLRATVYPPRVVLFRKADARYLQEGHTQVLDTQVPVRQLSGRIIHDDRKPLSRWITSQDRYCKIEARHLLQLRNAEGGGRSAVSPQDRLRLKVYFAAPVMFVYLLVVRGLILDGWAGWYYVMQRTLAEMLLSLRLLTERHRFED